jgi:hypothetical protein
MALRDHDHCDDNDTFPVQQRSQVNDNSAQIIPSGHNRLEWEPYAIVLATPQPGDEHISHRFGKTFPRRTSNAVDVENRS